MKVQPENPLNLWQKRLLQSFCVIFCSFFLAKSVISRIQSISSSVRLSRDIK